MSLKAEAARKRMKRKRRAGQGRLNGTAQACALDKPEAQGEPEKCTLKFPAGKISIQTYLSDILSEKFGVEKMNGAPNANWMRQP
jgi:hypothetical protein